MYIRFISHYIPSRQREENSTFCISAIISSRRYSALVTMILKIQDITSNVVFEWSWVQTPGYTAPYFMGLCECPSRQTVLQSASWQFLSTSPFIVPYYSRTKEPLKPKKWLVRLSNMVPGRKNPSKISMSDSFGEGGGGGFLHDFTARISTAKCKRNQNPPIFRICVTNSPVQNFLFKPHFLSHNKVTQRYNNSITGLDKSWGLQKVQISRFQDNRHMKVVRLSALRTGRLYPPGNIPGTHFC